MVEVGKYYKMTEKNYNGYNFYVKDVHYDINGSIIKLDSIYYHNKSNYYDNVISNHQFWNNKNNFKEITVDQFIIDYKGTNPLPVTSDIFHTLLF